MFIKAIFHWPQFKLILYPLGKTERQILVWLFTHFCFRTTYSTWPHQMSSYSRPESRCNKISISYKRCNILQNISRYLTKDAISYKIYLDILQKMQYLTKYISISYKRCNILQNISRYLTTDATQNSAGRGPTDSPSLCMTVISGGCPGIVAAVSLLWCALL